MNQNHSEIDIQELHNHVVVIGSDQVGKHLIDVLISLSIPLLVVDSDPKQISILKQNNVPIIFGDPTNPSVLEHAHLENASLLVSTLPDETDTIIIVTMARDLNPEIPIIVRASTEKGAQYLAELGTNHIVHPELEGGLELVHDALITLRYPLQIVHQYTEVLRRDQYKFKLADDEEYESLQSLLQAVKGIEIDWTELNSESPIIGKTLEEANIRAETGASVVAIVRDKQLVANPKSSTIFERGDRIGLIGDPDQLVNAQALIE